MGFTRKRIENQSFSCQWLPLFETEAWGNSEVTYCRGVILGKISHVTRVYEVLFSFISGYKNAGSQTKSRLSAGGNVIILQLNEI